MSFMIFHYLIHKVKLGHRIIINDSFIFWSLLSSQSCLIITGLYDQLLLISADIITNYSMIQVSFTISFYFPTFEASIPHSKYILCFLDQLVASTPPLASPRLFCVHTVCTCIILVTLPLMLLKVVIITLQFIFSTAIDGKIKAWLYDNMGSRVDYDAPGHWCTTMLYSADGSRWDGFDGDTSLFSCFIGNWDVLNEKMY